MNRKNVSGSEKSEFFFRWRESGSEPQGGFTWRHCVAGGCGTVGGWLQGMGGRCAADYIRGSRQVCWVMSRRWCNGKIPKLLKLQNLGHFQLISSQSSRKGSGPLCDWDLCICGWELVVSSIQPSTFTVGNIIWLPRLATHPGCHSAQLGWTPADPCDPDIGIKWVEKKMNGWLTLHLTQRQLWIKQMDITDR